MKSSIQGVTSALMGASMAIQAIQSLGSIWSNDDLSLGAKGLYCLVCYDLTVSLRKLLLNPDTKAQTIEYANELMK